MIFLARGGRNLMVLLFLGNHEYLGYSYSSSLSAVWELITVMQPRILQDFIFSEFNMY